MELSRETQPMELAPPTTSYRDLLDAQKDLFQDQLEKLQQIVSTQCKLTGVNPLSQEMAAGALSIRIGKRPRDLLNPKAVKYMQCLFSVKDAISKRETREISAQFGVTATQVRDFFNSQRTRVRKFVRLSREKANKSSGGGEINNEINSTLDPNVLMEPVPLEAITTSTNIDEGPSCSKADEVLTGMEESDQDFVQNILSSMRKEESFSGQVKLLQWILRIENPSVLNWFLTQGGLMILATWLSEAANEEQTSYLRVVLKVLHYLPMRKALPVHMSAILQSVNRLRFYRTSDISHRARILLTKWSEMFGKNLSLKKSNGSKSASNLQDEMLLKQSINEVMVESWDLKDNNHEEASKFLCDNPDNHRKLDTAQPLKMLTASGEDSNKRRGVLSSHARERRKVQMVEHPNQRSATRSPQVARSTPATQSRPLSADDIQKAKMRAQFMQSKYSKTTCPDEKVAKPESQNRCSSSYTSVLPSVSRSDVQKEPEEQKKIDTAPAKIEASLNVDEPPWKKLKRIQIAWQIPSEMKVDETWSVGDGANSKEVEVQKNRIRRERETIYRSIQEIPSNPREPWDREMDYDDTLTPEIPIEQLPDVETIESANGSQDIPSTSSDSMPEPDLELLAALLKNPDLVFALTSGKASDLSSEATVKLLDMIKTNGVGSLANLAGNADGKNVEVSLPSPTPSSDPVPNGQKPDFSRNPFSRQHTVANGTTYQPPPDAFHPISHQGMVAPANSLLQSQIPATSILSAQPSATGQNMVQPTLQQWLAPANPQMHHQPNSSNVQYLTTEMMINANAIVNHNRVPTVWPEPGNTAHHLKPTSSPHMQELNHKYQNNVTVNNYNAYARGAGTWVGRNAYMGRPEYESWSPDNSPSRHHEYLPGQYYSGPNVNIRQAYSQDRAMQQNGVYPFAYQDHQMGDAGNQWRTEQRR